MSAGRTVSSRSSPETMVAVIEDDAAARRALTRMLRAHGLRVASFSTAEELLQVYIIGNPRVKYQVVHSLGERAATTALMRIAQTEPDHRLQETAVVRLGQAGAREQLSRLYVRARVDLKRPIIVGLFNARAEQELIQIAEQERDVAIRAEVLTRLRLLGTEKARAYLEKQRQNR